MEYVSKTFDQLSNVELYDILKARVDIFVVEQKCPYPEIDGADQGALHLFIRDSGRILAYARIVDDGSGKVRIGRVITTVRGEGYGRDIMEFALRWINENLDAEKVTLEAQTYAIVFYEKFGFKVVSDEFWDDGIMHVWMEL